MDKNKLKTFAIESRRQLIKDTTYQANLLGITKDGIQYPVEEAEGMQAFNIGGSKPYVIYDDDIEKRNNLVKEVNEHGFENVIEEVAYTWFNRIIAIRYMEVNNYLPTRIRVLSSETPGKTEPDIIKEAPNIGLNLTQQDIQTIYQLKEENKNDELFQFLFIKQCNKLNEILPELFEKTQDYTELLFKISYSDKSGIIYNIINNISESDFNNIEVIGWLYQFYIFEKKEQVINIYKGKISKNDIPAATQLFTPDFIVKYMVDNSLGRYWIERNPKSLLKNELKYLVNEPQQIEKIDRFLRDIRNKNLYPEDIKFFDPCMGSGHILLYAFDILFKIYSEVGYSKKDIPKLILEKNIYGLDIDKRAYQLSYFSLKMKARQFDKNFLFQKNQLNICCFNETDEKIDELINYIQKFDKFLAADLTYLKEIYINSKEFGSLIKIKDEIDINNIKIKLNNIFKKQKVFDFKENSINNYYNKYLIPLIKQTEILTTKYDIVVTNPPYLNKIDDNFKFFSKKNYQKYSKDLFSMFMIQGFNFCKENGYFALISPYTWMFLQSFFDLREFIIKNKSISSLVQFEYSAFSEIAMVPVGLYVFLNKNFDLLYNGHFLKLSDYVGGLKIQNKKIIEAINSKINYKFISNNKKYTNIPGYPIAYWTSDNFINNFNRGEKITKFGEITGSQNKTAKNSKYIRYVWEVSKESFGKGKKWVNYAKGGDYRKYYGNLDWVVDWSVDAQNFYKNNKTSNLLTKKFWYEEGITYNDITSKGPNFRYLPKNCIFDMSGPSICFLNSNLNYLLGLLNSNVIYNYLDVLNPTIHIKVNDIKNIPIIISEDEKDNINNLVQECIDISKKDWNYKETSVDYKNNPLINYKNKKIEKSFLEYKNDTKIDFNNYLSFNQELNKKFNKIYNLDNEISYEIDISEVKLEICEYFNEVFKYISYAIGCLFGRFSLDEEGLVFAGGDFDLGVYSSFVPDDDNIVPVLDSEYFDDDVVGRFVEFVKVCFGEESLEENLDFIAGALKNKGKTSREVIRSYFLNDFFKDHVKMYKKCPIYWLFDSGKENGFKCLVYMHRYSPDLVARVRTDYLHKTQKAIESQISYEQNIKENSGNSKDQARADKRIKKLTKQLDETRRYDEALAHVASQNITIDLDDGVKVNYAKFQNVEVSKEGQKVKKINLLKKI